MSLIDTAAAPTDSGKPRKKATQSTQLDPRERDRLERAFNIPRTRFIVGAVVGVALVMWSAHGAQFDFLKLGDGMVNMGNFLTRMIPPDFSKFPLIVSLLVETLQMAIVGTVLGALLSLFMAFGAASNIAPKWLYYICRWTMNIIRSLPDLVIALMFVSAVGLGPFAGILAMTIGSIGSIGKIFAEAMEAAGRGPIVAMESVGASKRQIIHYGIVPQALPMLTSYTLLLFEGNVRGATILGLVGAGGIGLELTTAMNRYEYGHLCAMVICIIVLVTIIDQTSAIIRRKIT